MLTKSALMAWRQCPKRLWLEVHGGKPAPAAAPRLAAGLSVGALARTVLGGPTPEWARRSGAPAQAALQRTSELLTGDRTLLEAAFGDETLVTYADLVRRVDDGWELVEVKDAGSVKPHHLEDVAIQTAAARRGGARITRMTVAHLDTTWTYPGAGVFEGVFREVDVTAEVESLLPEVDAWVTGAQATLEVSTPPNVDTGPHCHSRGACAFHGDCSAREPSVSDPVSWLPGRLGAKAQALCASGAVTMVDLPDEVLNDLQLRVKRQTLSGEPWFDAKGAAADLSHCAWPLHFLDFETVNPAVPVWAGTRPYAQVPFQFSLHVLRLDQELEHRDFLLADGSDPSRPFAESLVREIGPEGSVVVYNAAFERTRIRELAARFPDLAPELSDVAGRLFDLEPVARARYYHPGQQGSWSIKKLLPCLAPGLRHDELEGVQDGSMAVDACLELLDPHCPAARRQVLERQLRRYCHLDTLAMVAIWACFTGNPPLLASTLELARRGPA